MLLKDVFVLSSEVASHEHRSLDWFQAILAMLTSFPIAAARETVGGIISEPAAHRYPVTCRSDGTNSNKGHFKLLFAGNSRAWPLPGYALSQAFCPPAGCENPRSA